MCVNAFCVRRYYLCTLIVVTYTNTIIHMQTALIYNFTL